MSGTGTAAADRRPWHREPWVWLVIAIPLVTVIGGFVTPRLPLQNPRGLVNDGSRAPPPGGRGHPPRAGPAPRGPRGAAPGPASASTGRPGGWRPRSACSGAACRGNCCS